MCLVQGQSFGSLTSSNVPELSSKTLQYMLGFYLEADVRRNKRKMWGFASWKIFGEAEEKGFKIQIFLRFSCNEQVSKFGFFRGFPQFLRGRAHPKKYQNSDFSAVSWEFEGRAHPISFKTQIFPQFSQDLEGTDPPKKLANLRIYPRFSWDVKGTDPTKNLANPQSSLDRNPATVWCEKHSQIASAHGHHTLLRPHHFR